MKRMMSLVALSVFSTAWAQTPPAETPVASASSWTDKISFGGDFRYRFEHIMVEGATDRHRHRIRARLGAEAKPVDNVKVGIAMASGDTSSATSTNQTLDGGFTSKDLWLDLAYLEWSMPWVDGLTVTGGIMRNPLWSPAKSDLHFDTDLTPEGIAFGWKGTYDTVKPFATVALFWVDERSADPDEVFLVGLQGGTTVAVNETVSLGAGVGFFSYTNIKGGLVSGVGSSSGNTVTGAGAAARYDNNYNILQAGLEAGFKFIEDKPLTVYFDYVKNTAATTNGTGWIAGFKMWFFGYNYRKLEADAVLGAFADADIGGGGADKQGHKFTLSCSPVKNVDLALAFFLARSSIASTTDNHKLIQADVVVKF